MSRPAESVFHENRFGGWLQTTGGIVAVLLLVQFFTGVLLAFYYVPSVDHAHTTVSFIEKVVSSGSWLRSLHHYGSQWLALFAFLHVARLFWDKAYLYRKAHWIAAIVLLALVMAAAGTGYSLPWDARAFFSTRVAEGLVGGLPFVGRLGRLWLLGGSDISTITLSRFFALHVLVTPFFILALVAWRVLRARCWSNLTPNAIVGALVFVLLAFWCWKFPAPLGPAVETATADYLPRPGAQFLWLYQTLKHVPGAFGSIVGVVLPGIGLALLVALPWLRARRRLIGGVLLGVFAVWVTTMTVAANLSDRRDTRTRDQLARQAQQEADWRAQPFTAVRLQSSANAAPTGNSNDAATYYVKFCADCHGAHGEGVRRGNLNFPPLLDVSIKSHRTVDDIVALLKDPPAYGLQPPMRSFSDKLSEAQMRQVAQFVLQLKR
jgi:ubiquinol-cytochrome c reductase cytochrome b subunit